MLNESLVLQYANYMNNNKHHVVYIYTKGRMYKRNREEVEDNRLIPLSQLYDCYKINYYGHKIEFLDFDSLSLEKIDYYHTDGYNYFVIVGEDNYILFSNELDITLMDKEPSWVLKNYSSKHIKKLYDTIDNLQKKLDELDNKITILSHKNNDYSIGVPHNKWVRFPSSLPDDVNSSLPDDINYKYSGVTIRDNSPLVFDNQYYSIKDDTK